MKTTTLFVAYKRCGASERRLREVEAWMRLGNYGGHGDLLAREYKPTFLMRLRVSTESGTAEACQVRARFSDGEIACACT